MQPRPMGARPAITRVRCYLPALLFVVGKVACPHLVERLITVFATLIRNLS